MVLLFAAMLGADDTGPVDEEEVLRLVRAAGRGNRSAVRRLYTLHLRRVYRAVRPLCHSDADAEDVVQEAFVRAFESIHRFTPRQGTRFAAWLCTIALNVTRKRRRGEARIEPASVRELAAVPGEAIDAQERIETAQRREALLTALAELPERDRRVISLRYGAELTAAEVGEACGVSEANVRKICERQRRKLLERLGGPAAGEEAQ